jgi:hypothetical protein
MFWPMQQKSKIIIIGNWKASFAAPALPVFLFLCLFTKLTYIHKKELTLFAIVLVCLTFVSLVQIPKGATFLGGSVSFYSTKDETVTPARQENKNTLWSIRPQLGKAIGDNKIAGFFFYFGVAKNRTVNNIPTVDEVKTAMPAVGSFTGGIIHSVHVFFCLVKDCSVLTFKKSGGKPMLNAPANETIRWCMRPSHLAFRLPPPASCASKHP